MQLSMNIRKSAFVQLGKQLSLLSDDTLEKLCLEAVNENNWFTKEQVISAIKAWSEALQKDKIDFWLEGYAAQVSQPKKVGLILAGNIPLVGLHDLLSVLISGHKALIKLSSQDSALISFMISSLMAIDKRFEEQIEIAQQLNEADAVIATGSDNTARYFKYYFGKKPHIIRQNRTSIGILNGQETDDDLKALGKDIFTYYGLGCRNISKIYIPDHFDLKRMIDCLMPYEATIEHHKFRNNYDYNKSIYLVNNEAHLDSGFFLMCETNDLVSPISVIYYEKYQTKDQLDSKVHSLENKVQCIVSKEAWYKNSLHFGEAQSPDLWDYADGVNTLAFLANL